MIKKKKKSPHRLVMGKNCLAEILQHSPERIVEVYVSNVHDPLTLNLTKKKIPIIKTARDKLTSLVRSDSHQGFVAAIYEGRSWGVQDIIAEGEKEDSSLILALDSITDPQNVGALLRAAECFGVDAVVWSKNRGPTVTAVVSKVSVGASELMPIVKVSNLADAMKKFQHEGYHIITSEINDSAMNIHEFTFPKKNVLIIGSEGKGVRPLLSSIADTHLYIPMKGKISSLNVSQAAAVILSFAG